MNSTTMFPTEDLSSDQEAQCHALLRSGRFTTCDIADVLLSLNVSHAGHLPQIAHLPYLSPPLSSSSPGILVGAAYPVQFAPKSSASPPAVKGHYADLVPANHIAVLAQPEGTRCAVLGSLVALAMQKRGVLGVVANGNVRDVGELHGLGLPVWARGRSIVGAGAETRVVAVGERVEIGGVGVGPGDTVVADAEGVVVVPRGLLAKVCAMVETWAEGERKVREMVQAGKGMGEAVKEGRARF